MIKDFIPWFFSGLGLFLINLLVKIFISIRKKVELKNEVLLNKNKDLEKDLDRKKTLIISFLKRWNNSQVNLELELDCSEIVGFPITSGANISTILRILGGEIKPEEFLLKINGNDYSFTHYKKIAITVSPKTCKRESKDININKEVNRNSLSDIVRVKYILGMLRYSTIEDILLSELRVLNPNKMFSKLEEILITVDLKKIKHHKLKSLTVFQKLRLMIAVGLTKEPKVMSIDDCGITNSIDREIVFSCIIERMKAMGITVLISPLYSSSYLSKLDKLFLRIDKKNMFFGTYIEVLQKYKVENGRELYEALMNEKFGVYN